jgi:hypothetical protein
VLEEVITRFRITPWYEEGEVNRWTSIEAWVEEDWERLLDIIHVVIQQRYPWSDYERLEHASQLAIITVQMSALDESRTQARPFILE